jgi:hypothetical protein
MKGLVTDLMFPNKFATWRNVEIKSLEKFYRDNIDVYINLETGKFLNGWPLGLESVINLNPLIVKVFNETDYEMVSKLFESNKNVKVFKGVFPSDTSHHIEDRLFKFVHLDVDNYQPYKESLEFFYNRMVKGGIILFDDYDCGCCPGANKAVDEFFSDKPENIQKNVGVYIVKL